MLRVFVGGSILIGATAHAELPGDPFITLDRTGPTSHLGAQVGMQSYPLFRDAVGVRLELEGQVVSGASGLYASLPAAHTNEVVLETPGTVIWEDHWGLGNLQVGAFHAWTAGDLRLTLRGGLAVPTSSEDLHAQSAVSMVSYERVTDISSAMHGGWLRAGVSLRRDVGPLCLAADLSVDTALQRPSSVPAGLEHPGDLLVHANLGAALRAGGATFTIEAAGAAMHNSEVGWPDRPLVSLAGSASMPLGRVRPSVGVIVPYHHAWGGVMATIARLGLEVPI